MGVCANGFAAASSTDLHYNPPPHKVVPAHAHVLETDGSEAVYSSGTHKGVPIDATLLLLMSESTILLLPKVVPMYAELPELARDTSALSAANYDPLTHKVVLIESVTADPEYFKLLSIMHEV